MSAVRMRAMSRRSARPCCVPMVGPAHVPVHGVWKFDMCMTRRMVPESAVKLTDVSPSLGTLVFFVSPTVPTEAVFRPSIKSSQAVSAFGSLMAQSRRLGGRFSVRASVPILLSEDRLPAIPVCDHIPGTRVSVP